MTNSADPDPDFTNSVDPDQFWSYTLCKARIYPGSAGQAGVVRCGEGVMYLTSLGRPTDIGLQ